jgi:tetratricopeptide (TPR) repeat protein
MTITEDIKSDAREELADLQRSPHFKASWQHAQQYLVQGSHAPALASYRNLVQECPGVSQLWVELGLAAAGDLDFAQADESFQRAMELGSGDSSLLVSIGQQYHRLRQLGAAYACFERAVTADPSSVQARLSLAAWFERVRRLDDAWECVQSCLAQHPKDSRALYFQAFLLHRKGLDAEAEAALRDLLKCGLLVSLDLQSDANHLLGVVLDALGQYDEAFGCLDKAKSLRRQKVNMAAFEQAYNKMDGARRRLLAELTPETLRRWREEGAADARDPYPLALLCGPPRSGTTLIEQILGAHPDILVFDEAEAFAQELLNKIQPAPPTPGLNFKSLNSLNAARRAQLTRRYFKSLVREMPEKPDGKLLLDKNPSTVASLHVWLRLFPE